MGRKRTYYICVFVLIVTLFTTHTPGMDWEGFKESKNESSSSQKKGKGKKKDMCLHGILTDPDWDEDEKLEKIKSYKSREPSSIINEVNNQGRYAIHIAAARGYRRIVHYLIYEGDVDINTVDTEGLTPLHHAAFEGQLGVVEDLLNHESINTRAVSKKGSTALHSVINGWFRPGVYHNTSVEEVFLKVIRRLVDADPALINWVRHDTSPLHSAAFFGWARGVGLLLSLGATPSSFVYDTALHRAVIGMSGHWNQLYPNTPGLGGESAEERLFRLHVQSNPSEALGGYTLVMLVLLRSHPELIDMRRNTGRRETPPELVQSEDLARYIDFEKLVSVSSRRDETRINGPADDDFESAFRNPIHCVNDEPEEELSFASFLRAHSEGGMGNGPSQSRNRNHLPSSSSEEREVTLDGRAGEGVSQGDIKITRRASRTSGSTSEEEVGFAEFAGLFSGSEEAEEVDYISPRLNTGGRLRMPSIPMASSHIMVPASSGALFHGTMHVSPSVPRRHYGSIPGQLPLSDEHRVPGGDSSYSFAACPEPSNLPICEEDSASSQSSSRCYTNRFGRRRRTRSATVRSSARRREREGTYGLPERRQAYHSGSVSPKNGRADGRFTGYRYSNPSVGALRAAPTPNPSERKSVSPGLDRRSTRTHTDVQRPGITSHRLRSSSDVGTPLSTRTRRRARPVPPLPLSSLSRNSAVTPWSEKPRSASPRYRRGQPSPLTNGRKNIRSGEGSISDRRASASPPLRVQLRPNSARVRPINDINGYQTISPVPRNTESVTESPPYSPGRPERRIRGGSSVIERLPWQESLFNAIRDGRESEAIEIINRHDDSIMMRYMNEAGPIYWASQHGRIRVIRKLLEINKKWLDQRLHDEGLQPIHVAAYYGHSHIVAMMFTAMRTNPRDGWGRTLLHWAARGGHIELMGVLIDTYGLSVNVIDRRGNTPLYDAARGRQLAAVRWLIEERGARLIANEGGLFPIHGAAYGGQETGQEIIRYFIEKGFHEPTVTDNSNATLLHLAAHRGDIAMVQWLIITYRLNKRCTTKIGATMLHIAARLGHTRLVKWLVKNGLSVKARTTDGETPIDWAEGNHGLQEWMKRHGT